MKKNVAILTLGCKVNQAESEQIASVLISKGYRIVDFKENPDIFIINTCAVTRESGHKSRKLVRRALSKNPESLVIATGCYVNYEDFNPSNIKGDVLFFRNEDKQKIIDLIPLLDEKGKNNKEGLKPVFHTRGLVKIQDGCDDFCSYCVVPFLRGKPRSKNPLEVVGEIDGLVKAGVKEVVITGVHIGKYGIDLEKEVSLFSLLKKILKIKTLKRVRLSSIDVGEINDEIIKLVAGERRIC
ncbi:MAG: tRNA (N(6)-L-threonylcarbamoyladenosine(37)-C(2))-methylthiotransferase MtaB, partial [Actinomycetia bacterium]|nr:tRNA (N(6)-L-threonylcarbamoyladenosine(37)-C(2))-methylthiotransferase MtaB [Actinomycetes bacterium]